MKPTPHLSDNPVPFERVAKFIRQLTHDVRNGLSAIDLEAAFISELVTDEEASDEVRKLRGMVSNTAKMLREISTHFQPVATHRMPWQAAIFFEELQNRVTKEFSEESVAGGLRMESRLDGEMVNIDLEQMMIAVFQVIKNAFQFREDGGAVRLSGFAEGSRVILEIRETKDQLDTQVPPNLWGTEPLRSTRSGGYGLGLFRTRAILEAHGGKMETHYRDSVLTTQMVLPICSE